MQVGYNPLATAHNLLEPNARYMPKGRPIRMALDRDPTSLSDVVGIYGHARKSSRRPDRILFTVDGYVCSDMEHSYWLKNENVEFLDES